MCVQQTGYQPYLRVSDIVLLHHYYVENQYVATLVPDNNHSYRLPSKISNYKTYEDLLRNIKELIGLRPSDVK